MNKYYTFLLTFLIFIIFLFNSSDINSQTGFVMGDHGDIFKTTNGGSNWILKPTGTSLTLWNSYFINDQVCFVCGGPADGNGGSGVLVKTTDNGESWAQIPTGVTTRWFTGVYFINSQTGFLAGEHGIVLKTINGGLNWVLMNNGVSDILLETINFTDSLTGWLTGWQGTLFKTTNAGVNWTLLSSGTQNNLYTAFFQSSETGYISGSGGTILKTTNAGSNWIPLSSGTTQEIFSIFFRDNLGWISGHLGTLRYTTNYGATWLPATIGTSTRLETVDFINSTTGWVVGGFTGSVIFKSTDGGVNWFQQFANTNDHFYSVNFYTGPLGISHISDNIPVKLNLHQNYPNPFNPTTKIRFDVPASISNGQNIVLKIYSELGKEVAKLIDSELRPGTYETEWDASGFSSGTYFYRLQNGSSVKTQKMMLIK